MGKLFFSRVDARVPPGREAFSEHEMKMTSFYVFITGVVVVLSVGIVSDWLVKKEAWCLEEGCSAWSLREDQAYAYCLPA
jgi:hypothetical protein